MMLLRTLIAVGMVGGGVFLAAPAQAGTPPVGSCPDGFVLVSTFPPMADLNGDGLACAKLLPTGFHDFIDNIVQG